MPTAKEYRRQAQECLELAKMARDLYAKQAMAADHARREVLLDAVGRGRGRGAQEARFELLAVGAVVDPFARCRNPFACCNDCRMPNDGYDLPMPTHLGAQNAKAILWVVVGDSLDKARQNF